MLLNAVETALMNNPIRRLLQRRFEAPRLLALGGPARGARALEIGCGQGVGVSVILERFGASSVDAFDLDPKMVRRAQARHVGDDRVRLWVGDVESVPAAAATYDAVFDFAIVHHVPDWRSALREVRRVLRPGGTFYAEEVLAAFIHDPLWRRVLHHPQQDRFDADRWCEGLEGAGFRVRGRRTLGRSFVWTAAVAV